MKKMIDNLGNLDIVPLRRVLSQQGGELSGLLRRQLSAPQPGDQGGVVFV